MTAALTPVWKLTKDFGRFRASRLYGSVEPSRLPPRFGLFPLLRARRSHEPDACELPDELVYDARDVRPGYGSDSNLPGPVKALC